MVFSKPEPTGLSSGAEEFNVQEFKGSKVQGGEETFELLNS